MSQIVLASGSPRRKELLEQVGLEFEVCPAKGEEVITSTIPEEVVVELSQQKAQEIAALVSSYGQRHSDITTPEDIMVIGADTVVACDGKILGKPEDEQDAKKMLQMLAGRTHNVFTGVSVVLIDKSGKAGMKSFYESTEVDVCKMTDEQIDKYIATGEPMDKAGAYGIQGKFAIHVKAIKGDYNNVVGLPVSRLYQELIALGIDWYLW